MKIESNTNLGGRTGDVLEHGPATANDGVWNYVTTTALPAGQPERSLEIPDRLSPGPEWLESDKISVVEE